MEFKLHSEYQPTGDQPQAIEALVKGFQEGNQFQTLLGVTGSGKTFTMANVIQRIQKPTLIIAHNKTLAAQLYSEFKEYFPENELIYENLPYTVEKEDDMYVVEGPKIEKMLGYTNLDSEKGFAFFQKFLKDSGILDELEEAGIQEGDTVRMYGLQFDYYK